MSGLVLPYGAHNPNIDPSVYIAETAVITGPTTIAKDVSIWHQVTIRADLEEIKIGRGSNIQDGSVLHVDYDYPCIVGEDVVVGHMACLHACTVGDGALIGIGAKIMTGAVVESGAQVAAGALVAPGKVVESGSLYKGIPARFDRKLSAEEQASIVENARRYVETARVYRANQGGTQ